MRQDELKLQAVCSQWFWNTYPEHRRLLHCNMNNSHNAIAGNKAKAVGVVAGVADLEFVWYRMYFIELKVGAGVQSPEQIDFQNKVENFSHVYLIIRSFQEFKTLICKLIGR